MMCPKWKFPLAYGSAVVKKMVRLVMTFSRMLLKEIILADQKLVSRSYGVSDILGQTWKRALTPAESNSKENTMQEKIREVLSGVIDRIRAKT